MARLPGPPKNSGLGGRLVAPRGGLPDTGAQARLLGKGARAVSKQYDVTRELASELDGYFDGMRKEANEAENQKQIDNALSEAYRKIEQNPNLGPEQARAAMERAAASIKEKAAGLQYSPFRHTGAEQDKRSNATDKAIAGYTDRAVRSGWRNATNNAKQNHANQTAELVRFAGMSTSTPEEIAARAAALKASARQMYEKGYMSEENYKAIDMESGDKVGRAYLKLLKADSNNGIARLSTYLDYKSKGAFKGLGAGSVIANQADRLEVDNMADWLKRNGKTEADMSNPWLKRMSAGVNGNFNPGNIMATRTNKEWLGHLGPGGSVDRGGGQHAPQPIARFPNMFAGTRGMAILALRKFNKGGLKTVWDLIRNNGKDGRDQGWTPVGTTGQGAAEHVAKYMGVGLHTPINLNDPKQLTMFIKGLSQREIGGKPSDNIPMSTFAKGANDALGITDESKAYNPGGEELDVEKLKNVPEQYRLMHPILKGIPDAELRQSLKGLKTSSKVAQSARNAESKSFLDASVDQIHNIGLYTPETRKEMLGRLTLLPGKDQPKYKAKIMAAFDYADGLTASIKGEEKHLNQMSPAELAQHFNDLDPKKNPAKDPVQHGASVAAFERLGKERDRIEKLRESDPVAAIQETEEWKEQKRQQSQLRKDLAEQDAAGSTELDAGAADINQFAMSKAQAMAMARENFEIYDRFYDAWSTPEADRKYISKEQAELILPWREEYAPNNRSADPALQEKMLEIYQGFVRVTGDKNLAEKLTRSVYELASPDAADGVAPMAMRQVSDELKGSGRKMTDQDWALTNTATQLGAQFAPDGAAYQARPKGSRTPTAANKKELLANAHNGQFVAEWAEIYGDRATMDVLTNRDGRTPQGETKEGDVEEPGTLHGILSTVFGAMKGENPSGQPMPWESNYNQKATKPQSDQAGEE